MVAADLVECRNTPRQTFVHDLESFFWVLLWIVLTEVRTSWTDERRSSFLKGTMSPEVHSHCAGQEKTMFLTSSAIMTQSNFQIPKNPTLCHLVHGLYKLVAARHHGPPEEELSPYDPDRLVRGIKKVAEDEHQHAVKNHEGRKKDLNDHSVMLLQFNSALNATWPYSDGASHRPPVESRSSSFVYASNSGSSLQAHHDKWVSPPLHTSSTSSADPVQDDESFVDTTTTFYSEFVCATGSKRLREMAEECGEFNKPSSSKRQR